MRSNVVVEGKVRVVGGSCQGSELIKNLKRGERDCRDLGEIRGRLGSCARGCCRRRGLTPEAIKFPWTSPVRPPTLIDGFATNHPSSCFRCQRTLAFPLFIFNLKNDLNWQRLSSVRWHDFDRALLEASSWTCRVQRFVLRPLVFWWWRPPCDTDQGSVTANAQATRIACSRSLCDLPSVRRTPLT